MGAAWQHYDDDVGLPAFEKAVNHLCEKPLKHGNLALVGHAAEMVEKAGQVADQKIKAVIDDSPKCGKEGFHGVHDLHVGTRGFKQQLFPQRLGCGIVAHAEAPGDNQNFHAGSSNGV